MSTVISIIRNLVFTAPYGAKCLGLKWYSFYPDIFRPVIFTIIASAIGLILGNNIVANNWLFWFSKAAIIGIIALGIGFYIILSKEDREVIISKISMKIRRKK